MTDAMPEPGDICCTSVGGAGGFGIRLAEKLVGGFSEYQHVFGYIGGMRIVEAEPKGCRIRRIRSFESAGLSLWSTGKIELTPEERQKIVAAAIAATMPGPGHPDGPIGYSWLDYVTVAAAKLHIPSKRLLAYVKATGHKQCAQLWDGIYLAAGVHLFSDNRPEGAVDPADIAGVIEAAPRWGLRR